MYCSNEEMEKKFKSVLTQLILIWVPRSEFVSNLYIRCLKIAGKVR